MTRSSLASVFLVVVAACVGCDRFGGAVDDGRVPIPKLYPVAGKITLDGKPLAGAVVTFMQVGAEQNVLTHGEADEAGDYELRFLTKFPGTAAGSYQVVISYLIGPSGKPQGLSAIGSLMLSDDMKQAVERLPAKYSDFGKSELKVEIPVGGGAFNFDLQGPLLPGPEVKVAEEAADDEPKPAPSPPRKDGNAASTKSEPSAPAKKGT